MACRANLSQEMLDCAEILRQLKEKEEAEPFLEPVDWKALELLDYPQVITQPMDLSTVEVSLCVGEVWRPRFECLLGGFG